MKGVSRIGRGIGTGVPTGIVIDPVASFRSFDRTRCRAKFRISRRNSDRIRGRKAGEQRFPAVSRGYFSCFAWKPVIFLTALALRRYLSPPLVSFSPLSLSVENKCHHRNRTTLELALFVSRYHFFLSYTFETEKFHFIYNNLDSPLELTRSQQKKKNTTIVQITIRRHDSKDHSR